MNLPRLEIEQTPAKLGLDIKKPEMKLKQKKADFELNQKKAEMSIQQENLRVEVDNYPPRRDMGYLNYQDRGKQIASKGKQQAMKGIAKKAKDGDRMAAIEEKANRGGKVIVQLAKEAMTADKREITIEHKEGPDINVREGNLEIDIKPQKPEINFSANKPEVSLNWGKVDAYLRQKPDLQFKETGYHIDFLI